MVAETLGREKRTDRLFFALSDATRRDIVTQTLDGSGTGSAMSGFADWTYVEDKTPEPVH